MVFGPVVLFALFATAAMPSGAAASVCDGAPACVPGGGSTRTDCLVEWQVLPTPPPSNGFPSARIDCVDGTSCDGDGSANGECLVSINICINNVDSRLPDCNAATLGLPKLEIASVQLAKPLKVKRDGFDAANKAAIIEALRSLNVPVTARELGLLSSGGGSAEQACTGTPLRFRVPLTIHRGAVTKSRKTIKILATTPPPAGGTKGIFDRDRLKISCLPNPAPPSVATPQPTGIGPSIVSNATDHPVQIEGSALASGTRLVLQNQQGKELMWLPTVHISDSLLAALVPEGFPVAGTTARPEVEELRAVLVHPYLAGVAPVVPNRFTAVDDLNFTNPNSAALSPDQSKLYITSPQTDEVWVYDTAANAFIDQDPQERGVQGIPVGDNPFHVETLNLGGGSGLIWVVNRFSDFLSLIDPVTDRVVASVPVLKMAQEVEFDNSGTRAFVTNQNRNLVQVFDISGNPEAPVEITRVEVGMSPRGMAINSSDTKLYVTNIQTADVSVIDVDEQSPTVYTLRSTPTGISIQPRAGDDIVGGFADGWEAYIIGGRAPRGVAYSRALDHVFVSSVGPNIGPRPGVTPGSINGTIMHPVITVIDASTDAIVRHIAIEGTDPEQIAIDDDARLLYVACQGSGQISVLDLNLATGSAAQANAAEVAVIELPLAPGSPTLSPPISVTGDYGERRCGGGTNNRLPCQQAADCPGSPLGELACRQNNPVGLHNGPRGIAIAQGGNPLYAVNQFTLSVTEIDTSLAPSFATSVPVVFGEGGFVERLRRLGQIDFFTDLRNSNVSCATCHIDDGQDGLIHEADVVGPRLRRVLSVRNTRDIPPLLQDQLVPDLRAFVDLVVHLERDVPDAQVCLPCTNLGCLFDGCFLTSDPDMEANKAYVEDVAFFPNPNLNPDGSLSTSVPLPDGGTGNAVSGATIFDTLNCANCHPGPLYTIDQFQPTVVNFSDLVRGVRMRGVGTPIHQSLRDMCQDDTRPVPKQGAFCVGGANAGLPCTETSACPGGSCEGTCVGGTNNGLPCLTDADCPGGPPSNPARCGHEGFGVPTLRGIWDSFPLLLSGSAGLGISPGAEPAVTCTRGSRAGLPCSDDSDCPGGECLCSDLANPANPSGVAVPERHQVMTERNALRSVLTANNPVGAHGNTAGLTAEELNDLMAFILSL